MALDVTGSQRIQTGTQRWRLNWWARRGVQRVVGKTLALLLLTVVGIAFLSPFVMMVSVSLKPPTEVFRNPPVWVYLPPHWENYSKALETAPNYPRYALNSLIVSGFNIVATLISCTLVAYGFAHIRWRGRDTLFFILIATMMIPYQVTLIPTFIIFTWLGWVDTLKPLTLPALLGSPFFIFMLRQFFLTIPEELRYAAKIDGASEWQIFYKIILPLSKPALVTTALFAFLWNWNDFIGPLIYLYSDEVKTLTLGLFNYMGREERFKVTELMAASVMTIWPVVVVFLLAQRFFIQGIKMTGIKE